MTDSNGPPSPELVGLPVELHLKILNFMYPYDCDATTAKERNRDLRHLSLTCHRFRLFAQDVMISSCHVQQRNLKYLFRTVIEKDLLSEITGFFYDGHSKQLSANEQTEFLLPKEQRQVLSDAIAKSYQDRHTIENLQLLIGSARQEGWAIAAVLLTGKKVKQLRITDPNHVEGLYGFIFPADGYAHKGVTEMVRAKIQDFSATSSGPRTLNDFLHFHRWTVLKRLELNFPFIWVKSHQNKAVPDFDLPDSMEYLYLSFPETENSTEDLQHQIDWFYNVVGKVHELPKIRVIVMNSRSTIFDLVYSMLYAHEAEGYIDQMEVMEPLNSWLEWTVMISLCLTDTESGTASYYGPRELIKIMDWIYSNASQIPVDSVEDIITEALKACKIIMEQ